MSKRSVTDNFTRYTGTLTRPWAGGPERSLPSSQSYFKRNYLDAVKIITPNVYFDDDISLSGVEVTEVDQLINSHILAADSSAVIYVSSLPNVGYLSSVSSIGGISKYFVKQNNLTWISPTDFENNILQKIGKTLSDFSSSGDLLNYISGTFLPTIELEKNDGTPGDNIATTTASAFANDSSGTHKYLIDKLSWIYFLNTRDPAGDANVRPLGYSTSGEVATLLAKKLWFGEVIGLDDCLKIFERYLWGNYYSFSSIDERILPEKYRTSGSAATSGYNALSYVSGTQHRDRLETLVSVLYEGDYFNLNDTKVRDSFSDYISTAALISDEDSAGPLNRALKAFSFSFADRSSEIKELETLVDIDHCPDELLPYLADLIGWTLIGPDSTRHRNQLRQAVSIYKAKGTKRSVQAMVDSVFGRDGAFNVTSGTLFDLWESYIPNIIFYTLMTSSNLTENGLTSFNKSRADALGLDSYSTNLETNVRLAVDRIMWELANEFPNNFIFGNSLFPRVTFFLEPPKTHLPAFAFEGVEQEEIKYEGPWNRTEGGDFYTGSVFNKRTSRKIIPKQDQNFIFTYRDRVMPIPPWEEIKYYSNCQVSLPLLKSLKKKLVCFGVDTNSANSVHSYIINNTLEKEDVNFYRNSFLFFTKIEQTPFNYKRVVNVTRPEGNDLLRYLPFWSSKSSHFKISLSASSFDFTSINLDKESKYALSRIKTLVNTVAPAHSTADIILDVSSVEDTNIALSAISTIKAVLGLSSVAASSTASATILTNFAVSTINPRNTNVLPAAFQNKFKRNDANSLGDALMGSGVADIFFSAAPRNAIRRKNHKYLMNWENVDIRDGKGSAGYDWLYRAKQLPINKDGGAFYPNPAALLTKGIFSLGFIPSSLSFSPVPLKRDPNNFGNLIDTVTISPVWSNCQAYNSSDSFFGVEVSTTFPMRGLSGVDSSETTSFLSKRGSLTEIQILQHRVREVSMLHEASSIVSGYYNPDGTVNSSWPVSSSKIQPVTVSSWYIDEYRDVLNSIANQLHENTSGVSNLNYMEDFAFGSTLHKFYKDWLDHYTRVPINFNFKYEAGANNIITHTYGPYLFNDDYEITASSIDDVAPGLITSSIGSVRTGDLINIGYYSGKGAMAMAPSNAWGITNYAASNAEDMYVGRIEVRNDSFLSGVEFVDTSNPYTIQTATTDPTVTGAYIPPNEPYTLPTTFAFLRVTGLDKDVENKNIPAWMRSSVLQDNLVIKYGRHSPNTFPRIRYKIEPNWANSASATITFAGAASNGDTITIIDTAGTSKTYTVASDGDPSDGEFPGDPAGGMDGLADGLAQCIAHANGHNGTITTSATATGQITLTQSVAGPGGNTSITKGRPAFATITFAGAASNGESITIIDTAGTSKTYTVAADGDPSDGEFPGDPAGGMNGLANGLTLCIEHANGHNGTITVATGSTGEIILTQSVAGSAGNTTITKSGLGVATVVQWSGGSDTAGLGVATVVQWNGGDHQGRPDFRNYLFPNSDYQIDINAANIHSDSDLIGGRTLKVWIHTEPISYTYRKPDKTYTTENSIWSFSNGTWVRHKLSDINEDLPFGIVPGLSIGSKFTEKNITDILRYGEKENSSMRDIKTNKTITPYHNLSPRIGCMTEGSFSEEEVPSVDRWASQSVFETLSFNFNTNNSSIKEQILEKIHTKDRKYYIEIFLETADANSFILLNTISMYNKTFRERAIVPTSYNKYELNKHELKACFDYFTSLSKSTLASRNAYTSSGDLGVSGGGRLSYRDNIKREIYALSGDGSFNQVSSLIIRGN